MKAVLDSCVLKLATLPNPANKAAFIFQLCRARLVQAFVTPDILAEYTRVLSDTPTLLTEFHESFEICHPLFFSTVIRHEPDNRFVECALACQADYLITVNTARGHFDRKFYERVCVVTPGQFLNQADVQKLLSGLVGGGSRFA